MEFNYRDGQTRRTPSPMPHPLSIVANISEQPLQGYEFAYSAFPCNVLAPRVFPTSMPINADETIYQELEKEQIRRRLEKEKIRRAILASEMALARRRELEEEVGREMAAERAMAIPMQRPTGISFCERVPMFFNHQRMNSGNNIHIFGRPHPQLPPQVDIKQSFRKTIKAHPYADHYGAKRKAVAPEVDDSQSLQKKSKQAWSCALCQINATSQKGLNDHLQGKIHKAKEASLRTQKIGVYSKLDSQTIQPSITVTGTSTSTLDPREDDQVVNES